MKNRRLLLAALPVLATVLAFSTIAYAQPSPVPAPGPTLTPTTAVVTALSMLAGVLTNWIQTGTLLGRWVSPKAWLPDLTMISTALGGFLGYIISQSPVGLGGTACFYGAMAAVAALVAGAAPGAAAHVHTVMAAAQLQHRMAMRALAKAAPPAPPSSPSAGAVVTAGAALAMALVTILVGAALIGGGASVSACSAQQAKAAENWLVNIAVDACQEAPQLAPPGAAATVVTLLCDAVDLGAAEGGVLRAQKPVQLDAKVWNGMKMEYAAKHNGELPKGMSAVSK